MSSATAAASETNDRWDDSVPPDDARPAAVLKGGPRGLEILVDPAATADAIAAALTQRLEEAPGFFRGNDVRVRIDGAIPAGCLARLEEIAARFELAIVEIGPRKPAASGPVLRPIEPAVEPAVVAAPPAPAPEAPEIEIIESPSHSFELPLLASPPEKTRMVVGPVRSGVILDHPGNVVVVGDVNPGAEVRAEGNIVILGRLRGIAHAAIGRELGFILALQLEPQQLRVGRLVARAPDGANNGIEIAYVTDKTIVVERYAGKLPHGLAAGI